MRGAELEPRADPVAEREHHRRREPSALAVPARGDTFDVPGGRGTPPTWSSRLTTELCATGAVLVTNVHAAARVLPAVLREAEPPGSRVAPGSSKATRQSSCSASNSPTVSSAVWAPSTPTLTPQVDVDQDELAHGAPLDPTKSSSASWAALRSPSPRRSPSTPRSIT